MLPTQAGHQLVPTTCQAPEASTHKDSTLAGGDVRSSMVREHGTVPQDVPHLDRHNAPMPDVTMLQVSEAAASAATNIRPVTQLANKEHPMPQQQSVLQAPSRSMSRSTVPTQDKDSTRAGDGHLQQNFPAAARGPPADTSRHTDSSLAGAAGAASFPGGLPVSDMSHPLRAEKTFEPHVTAWQGPPSEQQVKPQVEVAAHEPTHERSGDLSALHVMPASHAAVRATEKEMATQHTPHAQQETLGTRTESQSDHVVAPSLPSPAAGMPSHPTGSAARDGATERTGQDAVGLSETAVVGGHGTEEFHVPSSVRARDGEVAAHQTAAHGQLQGGAVRSTAAATAAAADMTPELDNTRDCFGVGGGKHAHQERVSSQCALQRQPLEHARAPHADARADSTVPRLPQSTTARATELELPEVQ